MTNRLFLVLLLGLAAAAGYGVRDLLPETETAGVAESEPAAPARAGSPVVGAATELSSGPESVTEMSTSGAAEEAVIARLKGGGDDMMDSGQPLDSYDDQLGDDLLLGERPSTLDPDYEVFLEELEAQEEAEDAAEPEPEKQIRLTKEEIDALDEEELRLEAETYDADMAELDEEIKWRLWEEGSYEFGPSEAELQAE